MSRTRVNPDGGFHRPQTVAIVSVPVRGSACCALSDSIPRIAVQKAMAMVNGNKS
jgi:hypothetical protein